MGCGVVLAENGVLRSEATVFVDQLSEGNYGMVFARFDEAMGRALPKETLRMTWEALERQVGVYERQTGVRSERAGKYEAVFVTCRFERMTLDVKVVFDPEGRVAGLFFLPAGMSTPSRSAPYVVSDAFKEREVKIGKAPWVLPGTLSVPEGSGPFPAVVLVHGTGPSDRDATVGACTPFRDLAQGLASRGIMVLRYEKRTRHYAKQMESLSDRLTTEEETVADALAAVAFVKTVPNVDARAVYVAGHSFGGTLAPEIGRQDPEIAGLIVLAGITRRLEDVIVEQYAYIFGLDGEVSDAERAYLAELEAQRTRVRGEELTKSPPSSELPLGLPAAYWLHLRGYRPELTAARLNMPMLILQGGRDYQATRQDFEGWREALGRLERVRFKWFPELNHLFVAGEGESGPADYLTSGHVSLRVIEEIRGWIAGRSP